MIRTCCETFVVNLAAHGISVLQTSEGISAADSVPYIQIIHQLFMPIKLFDEALYPSKAFLLLKDKPTSLLPTPLSHGNVYILGRNELWKLLHSILQPKIFCGDLVLSVVVHM